MPGRRGEAFLEGVERAGANVAVNDPDGAEGHGPERRRGGVLVPGKSTATRSLIPAAAMNSAFSIGQ